MQQDGFLRTVAMARLYRACHCLLLRCWRTIPGAWLVRSICALFLSPPWRRVTATGRSISRGNGFQRHRRAVCSPSPSDGVRRAYGDGIVEPVLCTAVANAGVPRWARFSAAVHCGCRLGIYRFVSPVSDVAACVCWRYGWFLSKRMDRGTPRLAFIAYRNLYERTVDEKSVASARGWDGWAAGGAGRAGVVAGLLLSVYHRTSLHTPIPAGILF